MLEIQDYKYIVSDLKKKKNNYIIVVNNKEYELEEETIVKFRLLKNSGFNDLNEILKFNDYARYLTNIKKYVARYLKSKYNYYLYFKSKYDKLDEELIINILDDLENKKIINDYYYASNKVEYLLSKKHSLYYIKQTLIKDKIDLNIIDELLENVSDENSLKSLIIKLNNKYQKYESKIKKQKVITNLLQKGFKYDKIRQYIEEIDE